jgi:hypothetical protein
LVPKLKAACYAASSVTYQQRWSPKSIYFAHFCSIMKYGITVLGNSSNKKVIFML